MRLIQRCRTLSRDSHLVISGYAFRIVHGNLRATDVPFLQRFGQMCPGRRRLALTLSEMALAMLGQSECHSVGVVETAGSLVPVAAPTESGLGRSDK